MVHTDSISSSSSATWSFLERLIGQIREDIGVEPACGSSVSTMSSSLSGSDLDESWERDSFDGTDLRSRQSSDNGSVCSAPSTFSYLKNGLLRKGVYEGLLLSLSFIDSLSTTVDSLPPLCMY